MIQGAIDYSGFAPLSVILIEFGFSRKLNYATSQDLLFIFTVCAVLFERGEPYQNHPDIIGPFGGLLMTV